MDLALINYAEHQDSPREWKLQDLSLGPINLIVGKNASGKSRTLNVIKSLALQVCGMSSSLVANGTYEVHFTHIENKITYKLDVRDGKVVKEDFWRGTEHLLDRGPGGVGTIWAERADSQLQFQTPDTALAVVHRRDAIQHEYLSPLYVWGKSVRHFAFGKELGHARLAMLMKGIKIPFDLTETENVVPIFRRGITEFGDKYKAAIIADMGVLGYPIEDVDVAFPKGSLIESPFPLPGELVAMYVKERSLRGSTEQPAMSMGMWRALAVLVQFNYSDILSDSTSRPSCNLIDDIGEGLDYERSTALIQLLIKKAKNSSVQLIMTTNDRFVMNNVPLEYWSVLGRRGSQIEVFNLQNSRNRFENFKYTGLNNFDFFSMDFSEEEGAN